MADIIASSSDTNVPINDEDVVIFFDDNGLDTPIAKSISKARLREDFANEDRIPDWGNIYLVPEGLAGSDSVPIEILVHMGDNQGIRTPATLQVSFFDNLLPEQTIGDEGLFTFNISNSIRQSIINNWDDSLTVTEVNVIVGYSDSSFEVYDIFMPINNNNYDYSNRDVSRSYVDSTFATKPIQTIDISNDAVNEDKLSNEVVAKLNRAIEQSGISRSDAEGLFAKRPVPTEQIADGAVTDAKIADSTISRDKLDSDLQSRLQGRGINQRFADNRYVQKPVEGSDVSDDAIVESKLSSGVRTKLNRVIPPAGITQEAADSRYVRSPIQTADIGDGEVAEGKLSTDVRSKLNSASVDVTQVEGIVNRLVPYKFSNKEEFQDAVGAMAGDNLTYDDADGVIDATGGGGGTGTGTHTPIVDRSVDITAGNTWTDVGDNLPATINKDDIFVIDFGRVQGRESESFVVAGRTFNGLDGDLTARRMANGDGNKGIRFQVGWLNTGADVQGAGGAFYALGLGANNRLFIACNVNFLDPAPITIWRLGAGTSSGTSMGLTEIPDNSITTRKIVDNAVTLNKLSADLQTIDTNRIKDGAITAAKLDDLLSGELTRVINAEPIISPNYWITGNSNPRTYRVTIPTLFSSTAGFLRLEIDGIGVNVPLEAGKEIFDFRFAFRNPLLINSNIGTNTAIEYSISTLNATRQPTNSWRGILQKLETEPTVGIDEVSTADIQDGAVTEAKLSDVVQGKINADVGISQSQADARYLRSPIDTDDIANDAITSAKLASNSVTRGILADNSVDTSKISNNAVDGLKIASNSINAGHMRAGAVTSGIIADGAVSEEDLSSEVRTKLNAELGITQAEADKRYLQSPVGTDDISNDAITSAKLAENSVTRSILADNTITTNKISNNAVTGLKIADRAINAGHMSAGAVTSGIIADGSVSEIDLDSSLRTKINSPVALSSTVTIDSLSNKVLTRLNRDIVDIQPNSWTTSNNNAQAFTLTIPTEFMPSKGQVKLTIQGQSVSTAIVGSQEIYTLTIPASTVELINTNLSAGNSVEGDVSLIDNNVVLHKFEFVLPRYKSKNEFLGSFDIRRDQNLFRGATTIVIPNNIKDTDLFFIEIDVEETNIIFDSSSIIRGGLWNSLMGVNSAQTNTNPDSSQTIPIIYNTNRLVPGNFQNSIINEILFIYKVTNDNRLWVIFNNNDRFTLKISVWLIRN